MAHQARAGAVLAALARPRGAPLVGGAGATLPQFSREVLLQANASLVEMAKTWSAWANRLPGGHPKARARPKDLVGDFLATSQRGVLDAAAWPGWQPGSAWDLTGLAELEPELRARCRPAPATATFASVCR